MADIIRFVDRETNEPVTYEIAPMDGVLKYTLKKNLPESLPRNVFIYTIDTQEIYHGSGYGLPIKKVYTEQELVKTAVFYFGEIKDPDQTVTLFTPLRGFVTKLYVNLSTASIEDLHVLVESSSEEIADVVLESGETFAEFDLEGTVSHESIKVTLNGELSLMDINVLVDILPIRNEN